MSIKIGNVDVQKEIIELRYEVIRTQMILESIINSNAEKLQLPTEEEMKEIEENAVEQLMKFYPGQVSKKSA